MLGCNFDYIGADNETLLDCLSEYRNTFLSIINRKNGYKYDIHKDTPKEFKIIFAAFERMIENKPLFKADFKALYLKGIKHIYNEYYSVKSTQKQLSKAEKTFALEIDSLANNYLIYNK